MSIVTVENGSIGAICKMYTLCFFQIRSMLDPKSKDFTQTTGGLIRDPFRVHPVTDRHKVCGEAGNVALDDNLIAADDLDHSHIYSVALGGH